ncbi:lipoyl synthase [Oceanidesulfovibrio indonesiensis]|uniref:Lipoyl synthase n=1 Tax=Oceanidesulfovibrio indonesiensis TaxID=54767 RepID=A0A7M3MGR8_9BACT|nr:radical SAM protein [Oceanidesulfovibrio indonesiensis]TVM18671.1 lipoyl synthase [Oceanidesulfovibrio indonesiensis]
MPLSKPSERTKRLPPWLRVKLPKDKMFAETGRLLASRGLHTVCQSARCPNIFECFSRKVATFMILGAICSRNCAFCNIDPGQPSPVDPDEPRRLAEAARELGLRHVVVTSVTRDDLTDGGAGHFAAAIRALKQNAGPDVVNHNVETVPRRYPEIRPQADYRQSLTLLSRVASAGVPAKSGLMVGLGETDTEVNAVIRDLAEAGCSMVTVGQYLAPSRRHPEPDRYVPPAHFDEYAACGTHHGIPHMFCGPHVRSSYRAEKI